MHKEHEAFTPPNNENVKIWRYMDFTKYVSILDKKSLFFPAAHTLAEFDPFEGSLPKAYVEQREAAIKKTTDLSGQSHEILRGSEAALNKGIGRYMFINSWHVNDIESFAMWNIYVKSNEGIALQSTFKRLKDSFDDSSMDVFIGLVDYIDYDRENIPFGNVFSHFLYKRKSFEYERELRAVILRVPSNEEVEQGTYPYDAGAYIPVDVATLIEKIYVSPSAPKWLYELVRSMTARYGFSEDMVIQSSLRKDPLY